MVLALLADDRRRPVNEDEHGTCQASVRYILHGTSDMVVKCTRPAGHKGVHSGLTKVTAVCWTTGGTP